MPEWIVPGYTEMKRIGSGGFGDVVLARHDASGALVAIKYLHQDLLADDEFAEMFRSEAVVLGSLADPNIVRLYEYVESPAGAAIVMELIGGVSLREILTYQGKTTAEAALVVLQGSLLGLAAAHRRGVVHRDFKPENVLVSGDGISKLTDFGIAARTGDNPVPAGTLRYAAPEQMAGAPASPASDMTLPGLTLPGGTQWLDTGVYLNAGDGVGIRASGTIYINPTDTPESPNGDPNCTQAGGPSAASQFPDPDATCYSLIGRIGNGAPFEIGSATHLADVSAGELYIEINDNYYPDNTGSWSVSIAKGGSLPP
jgi:serine/threonine protein kinase